MLQTLLHILFIILFIYFLVNTLYLLVISMAGRFRKQPHYGVNPNKKRIAVLMPTYKEDNIVVDTARRAKGHDYPASHFEVFVAADQLKPETIALLREIPVQVREVKFDISSKARSLNQLLNNINPGEFDVAIILDADNIMLPGCLEKVNDAFQRGFRAVQVHRTAKNRNTPVAVLDAMSEEVNNHLFRRGQRALGFSANVIGSGMAFEFEKLKEIYNKPGILGNPACDREVDFEVMKADIVMEFIDDAWVLDEKVASKAVYERQRTRWLESQVIHLKLFFDKNSRPDHKTKNYWNKLFNNLILPRLIFLLSYLIILVVVAIQYATGYPLLAPAPGWWLAMVGLYALVFLLAIPSSFYSMATLRALAYLPVLMFSMVRALIKMKVSRKEFLHTPKTFTQDVRI